MILVFGKTGQVARELARLLPDAMFLGRDAVDLTQPDACADAIGTATPDAVINAAAYTAVDKAESEEQIATLVNGRAPTAMAEACAAREIPLVHVSTDYVFDGGGQRPWTPQDKPAPISAYGRSKLAGETGILTSGARHAIMRTSWVFSAHGGNFVKTMLRLSETWDRMNVVADQVGAPTPASAIAKAAIVMAEGLVADPTLSGIYHFAGTPDVSRAKFAREIFRQAGRAVMVEDIPTVAYPTAARRPSNSRLDCASLSAFALARPDWKAALSQVLAELGART